MKTLEIMETHYGTLRGVTNFDSYPDGHLRSCMLCEENTIETRAGRFIPQYCADEFGDRQKKHRSSLSFHPNGEIKSAALQHPAPIQTPLGTFDAELVTFYEDGGSTASSRSTAWSTVSGRRTRNARWPGNSTSTSPSGNSEPR